MKNKGLQEFIEVLERENELIRIKEFVSPLLEIPEVVDRMSKTKNGGKALLFENNGTSFPLLINAFGSEKRISLSLKTQNLDFIGQEIFDLFKKFSSTEKTFFEKLKLLPLFKKLSSYFPKTITEKGSCQEIISQNIDIQQFPILKCWTFDSGKFITLPIVITKDAETGIRNAGMYRMQIFEKNLTALHWHKHKTAARHFEQYKKLQKPMPVAVILGGDSVYSYCATAPLPDNFDEFIFAGFLRKKRVKMVRCLTQPLEIPEDADIVIEGFVNTKENFILEGPFGDHTGFYSLPDFYPQFHITCISHRKNAIYPATIVGIPPQEDKYFALATEKIFLTPIKMTLLPEVVDLHIPDEGVAHNLTFVKINSQFDFHAVKIFHSLWGAGQMIFNKIMVIFDSNINIRNYFEVLKEVSQNVDIQEDIYISQGITDVLEHSSQKFTFGGKLGIDATRKQNFHSQKIENIEIIEKNLKLFNEIFEINTEFLKKNISVLIFSIKKTFPVKELIQKLTFLKNIKFVIIVDNCVDIFDFSTITWWTCSNTDPKRDCYIIENQLFIDGTIKNKKFDNFQRDFPNPVLSSDETISSVDEKWNRLNLGEFIPSPSLKYRKLVQNEGAIVKI